MTTQSNLAYSITEIEALRRNIDVLSKIHHIAILKIIKKNPAIIVNENKSGVYINLTFLPKETYDEIVEYLSYIEGQENMLEIAEKEKSMFKNQIDDNIFEKEDKDNFPNKYSYIC
jgi:predicted mannosyl-3-phosphoglycerate phosphatase (HAD superfamily)